MLRTTQLCAALALLTLGAWTWGSLAPAQAQDPVPERAATAPPSSQRPSQGSPPERELRDPTRAPGWRAPLGGNPLGVELPELRLRARVVSKAGALALLEVDGRLHLVRPGDSLSVRVAARAAPSGARDASPLTAPLQTLTLRVQSLDARSLELELLELGRTLTLR